MKHFLVVIAIIAQVGIVCLGQLVENSIAAPSTINQNHWPIIFKW